MTFLNPLLLVALPLIALPLLIHLVNQRRHRTIDWGAMQFLLTARKSSRGMARLRHLLIMAARMAVIGGLVFAISRPLATGWVGGLTSGKPETVIVLLDRSASMQQQQLNNANSKIKVGLEKITDMLEVYGGANDIVLIDSATLEPVTIEKPEQLLTIPQSTPTESSANVPAMLQKALEFVADNKTGRTDVWLCSDSRRNDWDAENSKWESLKSGFAEFDGVRFHVLNYREAEGENLSVVAENVMRQKSDDRNELVFDIRLTRDATGEDAGEQVVPIGVIINGVRSVVNARLVNNECLLAGYRISLDQDVKSGWGKVELPADDNVSDNAYYFTFAEQPVRKTVIVTEDKSKVRSLDLVCRVAPQQGEAIETSVVSPADVASLDWNQVALLLWQAPLPQGTVARQVKGFVNSGKSVVFFPPEEAGGVEFEGVSWGAWANAKDESEGAESDVVGFWRKEADLLRNTRDGSSLPLDQIKIYQHCSLKGTNRMLARLEKGQPLLTRKSTDAGALYFCTTLPGGEHSSLSRNGVVLYAMLHRALDNGLGAIGNAKQFEAGTRLAERTDQMTSLATNRKTLAENRRYCAGAYQDGETFIALNCPPAEASAPLAETEVASLFEGLEANFIDDSIGSARSLASEIWKVFVILMGIALLLEALLSLPPRVDPNEEVSLNSIGATAAGVAG